MNKNSFKYTYYRRHKLVVFLICAFFLLSCEKKIAIDLPKSDPVLVVEACINDYFPTLNYVFISYTVDYFNPDLTSLGVSGAQVYITEGSIVAGDTLFDPQKRILSRR